MEGNLITTLLGILLTSSVSQTIAVWVKFSHLEKKIVENRCPFGLCPLWARAKDEAVESRIIHSEQADHKDE